jgi:hypothetical protein
VRIASHLLNQTGGISFLIDFSSKAYSGGSPEELDEGDDPGGVQPTWIGNPTLAGGIDHPEI